MKYTKPLNETINFGWMTKRYPMSGKLAWEYNPFRNYRLSENKYYFRNKWYTKEELEAELGITIDEHSKEWNLPNDDDPILYEKGSLVDFETNEFNFDIQHPVEMLPQYSYDNSVNLIINDNKNYPKLINSRFSTIDKNTYQIVDRKGENDTNIYDQGEQFDTDVSLYKTYKGIPKLHLLDVLEGGNLKVGKYHFYFRYVDADGNETDFIAESGAVSIFKGSTLKAIHSGFREDNGFKSIRFRLTNIDPAYPYVKVYYTRASADLNENAAVNAYVIDLKYLINQSLICNILITGSEPVDEVSVDEINPMYLIAEYVKTLAVCQNMLFFGNIHKSNIAYADLFNMSLHITPTVVTREYVGINYDYESTDNDNYRNAKFIYKYTGYQNREFYRFGIVYIMNDGSLTPVFNIRGYLTNPDDDNKLYKQSLLDDKGNVQEFKYSEDTGILYNESKISNLSENVYGVLQINHKSDELRNIYGIQMELDCSNLDFYNELKKRKVKGFFFVRQKRQNIRLCLAFTVGIDLESHTPVLYTGKKTTNVADYITESFLTNDGILEHGINNRLKEVSKNYINTYGAICPDYDVNSPYLNSLFCGEEYLVELASTLFRLKLDEFLPRHFHTESLEAAGEPIATYTSRILGIEDNTKLQAMDRTYYSARAGEAEEGFRFAFIGNEDKRKDNYNILRASYGPYIGLYSYNIPGTLIDISLKDAKSKSKLELLGIRAHDKSSFFAISERYAINELIDGDLVENNSFKLICYRGDSYICTFTHRFNRNFLSPSFPTSDTIFDKNCWKDHFDYDKDGVIKYDNFADINLNDINAVKIGIWITLKVVSSINLNIRAIDESHVDEAALNGQPRIFYPYSGMSAEGNTKIPEALCYNKAFDKSLSERYNFEMPNVPAIKNDFTNRISYSEIFVNDIFKNGFRIFQGTHYRDYPKTYGSITKLLELGGNLFCVFEHGIAIIPVNERAVAGEGAGGMAYINTSNVLPENPKIISDIFGSQWADSVIKTQNGIYGVDTVAKKIWKFNGNVLEVISDFKVQEFLNNNISLGERELEPIIGVRNVKTHYNRNKEDVMFTFYDNLYDFEERAWNLCWNDTTKRWTTFYSWMPSYSENIQNIFFSFDRSTSKWISKLGISKSDNDFSDGVVLTLNVFNNNLLAGDLIGYLDIANRTLPEGTDVTVTKIFTLERDNFGNYKNFKIKETNGKYGLYLKVPATNLCSELFVRGTKQGKIYKPIITDIETQRLDWIDNCVLKDNYIACKDDRGQRINLTTPLLASELVLLLNIKCTLKVSYNGVTPSIEESTIGNYDNKTMIDAGYYKSVVAVMPKYNEQFLTTDFWKHGQAGLIDIADKIYPTYWYGKQHPFEFEFVVNSNPGTHKIFDNLEIIGNNAEPESFHYEIIGDCYSFADDKKNAYIRQEATKELYQYNEMDVVYDHSYKDLEAKLRPIYDEDGNETGNYDKSVIFPWYYSRQDTINEMEDFYHLKDNVNGKNFSQLAGAEVVRYENLDEYRIWNHAKAKDIRKSGRLRGNMQYKEDKWDIQINPINLVEINEEKWDEIPIDVYNSPIPDKVKEKLEFELPEGINDKRLVAYDWKEARNKEVKPKDKWIKIRVRYCGKKLAVIYAIRTLYSISYS